jgi:flagellar operon protein
VSVLTNPALVPPGLAPAAPAAPAAGRPARDAGAAAGPTFASVLSDKTAAAQAPQFSRHALERIQRRGINLEQPTLQRLASGVARAAGKGSRDSVVFVDGTAFVVSVRNNTVVTAVGAEHMREQVFTNIDSAVIA